MCIRDRLESMQLQKSAQAQLEQTRRLEAAMTELTLSLIHI